MEAGVSTIHTVQTHLLYKNVFKSSILEQRASLIDAKKPSN